MAKEDASLRDLAMSAALPARPSFGPLAICALALYAPAVCGIGGILRVHPPGGDIPPPEVSIPEAWLDVLDESIRHRGPDGQGRFRDRAVRPDGSVVDVALVHRRLSIIDHACGAQPMVSIRAPRASGGEHADARRADRPPTGSERSGSRTFNGLALPVVFHGGPNDDVKYRTIGAGDDLVAVVFNGCIYNHRELRGELQARGHAFVTDHSDTEVLIHGWRAWQDGLFSRLDGMFALAVWDRRKGDVIWARDPFGEKPLHAFRALSGWGGIYAFASSPGGLIRLRSGCPEWREQEPLLDAPVLRGWIQYGWNQASPFGARMSTNPGFSQRASDLTVDGDLRSFGIKHHLVNPRMEGLSAASVDDLLRQAVHSRLEADVRVGSFLSGGIDSALITRYAAEVRRDVPAFTVRMPDARYDESEAAARTAAAIGVRHHVLDCDANPAEDLQSTIEQLGLPFGDSSLLPSLWVSRAARREVSVCLSGDGGDELFMGYDRHRAMPALMQLEDLPWPLLRALCRAVPRGGHAKSFTTKLSRLVRAAYQDGYAGLTAIFLSDDALKLGIGHALDWDYIKHCGYVGHGTEGWTSSEWVALSRQFDLECYLPEDLMRKTDTASMASALEVRSPFLSLDVARPAIHASVDTLMPNGQRKGLLRAVARKYFPADIVDRPKMGFAIPIGEWFRSDYGQMRQLLLDHLAGPEPFGPDALGINAMINMDFVRRMLREHDEAGRASLWPWKGRDHSQRLYMLLVLSIWAKWLGGLK